MCESTDNVVYVIFPASIKFQSVFFVELQDTNKETQKTKVPSIVRINSPLKELRMPDPMMVRLAVSSPDSLPLSGSTQVIAQVNNSSASGAANNNYVHQTETVVAPTTTPPAQTSISPTQQNSHQMAPNIPPGVIPLNQMSPHHMPPYHHHQQNGVLHDHSNGHHHNGLYLGPAYTNEFYPAGGDPHGAYYMPPELCPAHTQLCTVHPEYGKRFVEFWGNDGDNGRVKLMVKIEVLILISFL